MVLTGTTITYFLGHTWHHQKMSEKLKIQEPGILVKFLGI